MTESFTMHIAVKCLFMGMETRCDIMELSTIKIEEFDPTFLYFFKGTKTADGPLYDGHDYAKIVFILSGQGKYRIADTIYAVSEGDILLINPCVKHQVIIPGTDNSITEAVIGFTDVQFERFKANEMPLPQEGPVVHTQGELRQKLFKIYASMDAENAVHRTGKYFMLKSYLMQVLLLLVREQTEAVEINTGFSFKSANKKYVVEQILSYFEDHYAEKISLDQIADNTYLSTVYISKIFKSETGNTPIRHLINIRLEKAKELLENGWEGSIQEVAMQVGYDDAYHFSKLFKKRYGVSPSKVAKMVEEE